MGRHNMIHQGPQKAIGSSTSMFASSRSFAA